MRRGEVYIADLGTPVGSEAAASRPVVVVSRDAANQVAAKLGRGVVTVVPLTTNVARVYPFQVLVPASASGLPADGKAQAEQVRAIAVERLRHGPLATLSAELMRRLDDALRLHLGLDA